MSRERFDDSVVRELEDELRQALAIEPSPEFARRVAERIQQRRPTRMHAATFRVALAAAAVCVLAVGLGWRAQWFIASAPQSELAPSARGSDFLLPADVAPPARVVVAQTRREPRVAAPLRPAPEMPEPEILVPNDRALAIDRLLELARAGALDDSILPPAAATTVSALEVTPIVVPLIPLPSVEIQNGATRGGDRE